MVENSFRIWVYYLPLLSCNEYIENLVGNALGKVKEIDMVPGKVEWGKFMRKTTVEEKEA